MSANRNTFGMFTMIVSLDFKF